MPEQTKKYRVGAQSMKRFFETLHPDYKKILARKLKDILTHCNIETSLENSPPSLEYCFTILGACEARLELIKEIQDLVRDCSHTWMRSIKEITDLKELIQKQRNITQKLIRGHLYELSKENENGFRDFNQ